MYYIQLFTIDEKWQLAKMTFNNFNIKTTSKQISILKQIK